MRGNDPDSAEYFAKVVGTVTTKKLTERTKRSFWQDQSTGDGSLRETEEFIVHPNRFKSGLGVGEAVMVIPHEGGSRTITIKFQKFDDLEAKTLEQVPKTTVGGLELPPQHKGHNVKIVEKKESA